MPRGNFFNEPPTDENGRCEYCMAVIKAEDLRNYFKEKGPDYNICRDPSYFTNGITDEYPISYRLVLLNIINKIIKDPNLSTQKTVSDFSDLIYAIEQKKQHQLIYENYFQLFTFKDISSNNNDNIFAILIDKTKGTSPLFFYPPSSTPEKKGHRVAALYSALKEIMDNFDMFVNYLHEINIANILEDEDVKNRLCTMMKNIIKEEE